MDNPTLLTQSFDLTNADLVVALPFPSGTVHLVAGQLYLISESGESTGGLYDHSTSIILHNGVDRTTEWTFLGQSPNGVGTNFRRIAVFWGIAVRTEDVQITIDPPTGQKACYPGNLVEIATGFDSGTPIATSKFTEDNVGSTTHDAALDTAPSASDLSLVFLITRNTTEVVDPDAAFTEIGDILGTGTSSDSGCLEVQYKAAATQHCTSSVVTATLWVAAHVVIKASGAPPSVADYGIPISKPIIVPLMGGYF